MTLKRLALALLLAATIVASEGCRHRRCSTRSDSNADACRDF